MLYRVPFLFQQQQQCNLRLLCRNEALQGTTDQALYWALCKKTHGPGDDH